MPEVGMKEKRHEKEKEGVGDKKKQLNACLRSTVGHPFMSKPVSTHS